MMLGKKLATSPVPANAAPVTAEAAPAACDVEARVPAAETPPRLWLGHNDAMAAVWLVGSLLCITLAACMSVGVNRRVYLFGWSQPVPETCMAYSRFGIDCPGCGLTRTFVHLTHGDLVSACQFNPVGVFVFLFACVQIPFGIAQLVFRSRGRWVEAWGLWNDWATGLLMMALVLQWLVRLSERIWM